jgi:DNA-binding XRE family transcriptional regulator
MVAALRIAHCVGKPVEEIFQLVEGDNKNNFPSVPGCGQEHHMKPEQEKD